MYSCGPLHMGVQRQDDQLEHTYGSYVPIRDVALRTCRKQWTIGKGGDRGSGISVLIARHDDDDIYIYIYIYENHLISLQTFFVRILLLIVHSRNSSRLRGNLLRWQCTCCTVPTTSGKPHGRLLVWACQWPSSQPLSSPQLSHNDSLWA